MSEKMEAKYKREMYPYIEPYNTGMLKVSDLHTLYYEQCGNPNGKPVMFLHGGPGAGFTPRDRSFFDPSAYRIILMDQRGSGKSIPPAELKDNTTWHIIEDVEKLREELGIDKWVVFGGSWGSTLCLIYAILHTERVKGIIIRGIFLSTRREQLWLNQDGVSFIFPDAFEEYLKPIPLVERGDIMAAYHRRLTGEDKKVALECARTWAIWELATANLRLDPMFVKRAEADLWSLQSATIECHYAVNGAFLPYEDWVLDHVDKIQHLPITIVQGRYDLICPFESAWKLHKKLPNAEFFVIPDAGHSNSESGTQTVLLDATDRYKLL